MTALTAKGGSAMSKPQKRDRVYYEERLQRKFTAIYGDLLA